ncbi:hypothetical protein VRU48_09470 [Pedobacter sp. KR3-3]|uniref:Iron complex transport system substrate-binding protein n=1 Tax=Pedobacter albus TaxID=3113905 RepID=A0ABU7I7K1_9SPHI|nr:hypothetical protein [Pedobacter sp. KR3-3]MEE1945337.1 hypothetical protein [Pedobacter sp. KR3-3]
MSFLNELINSENDPVLREELQERVDIVAHKIKFIEQVPVVCLDLSNSPSLLLAEEIKAAGGMLETDVLGAVYIIYYQPNKTLTDLMREVPALLDREWQAVKNGRVILLNDDAERQRTPENAITLIEDMAEMTHPGHFIFGHEGSRWIRFSV